MRSTIESGWRQLVSIVITLLAAATTLGRDIKPGQESVASDATQAPSLAACGPGWCGVHHSTGVVPPWAQRIRDRGVARATATDGVWDPSSEPETIDVLFLYTPTALAAEGSVAGIQRRIDAMMASANRVYSNSLTGVRIHLVHFAQVNQQETASMLAAYGNFRNLPEVSTLRENYKADVVFLMVEQEALGFLGLADTTVPTGDALSAFGAVRRVDPSFREDMGLILAHEIAHLLGAAHDREHSYTADLVLFPGVYPYSYGHRFDAGGITFRDVMSYDPGVMLPFFSNPRLTYAGQPLGVAAGQPDEADVSQTITRMAPLVARYRTANSRIGFTQSALTVSEGDSSVSVELTRVGDVSTAAQVSLTFPASGSAKPSLDFRFPTPVIVQFAAGQSNAVVEMPILQDDLPEGDEKILIGLGSVQGQHGLARSSSLTVTIVDDDPSYTLIAGDTLVAESSGEATWSVRFSGPLPSGESRTIDVVAGLDGDSATLGRDFEVTPSILTFTDSQRVQSFRIRGIPDALPEPDETLRIQVGNLTAQLRITDDDRPGTPTPLTIRSLDGVLDRMVPLPDGRVALSGNFSQVNETPRSRIAIVDPDQGVDDSFKGPAIEAAPLRIEGMVPAWVEQIIPSRSGGWLVAGHLGLAGDAIAGNVVRLHRDGSLDQTFRSKINGRVVALTEQADGRILVGGWFTGTEDRSTRGFVRLNADGSFDSSFRLEPGTDGRLASFVNAIQTLPDGRILMGGYFETYNRSSVTNLVRLLPDGTLDESFPLTRSGVNNPVNTIQVLPDGRAYVGGYFTSVGGRAYRGICRLTAEGAVDTRFRSPRPNGEIWDILPLPNGQVLIAGAFTLVGGSSRRYVALLNDDGSVDASFDPGVGPSDHAFRLAALGDGTALVAGSFTSFGGRPAPGIARLRLPSLTGSFTGISLRPDGTLEARLWGLPGATLAVEASDDLVLWSPLTETKISTLSGLETIALPAAGDRRFFRVK